MERFGKVQIGVCSWSLRPSSPGDLVEKVRAAGLRWVQLHLDPIRRGEWDFDETVAVLSTPGALEAIREGQSDADAGRFADNDELKARHHLR